MASTVGSSVSQKLEDTGVTAGVTHVYGVAAEKTK